MKAKTKYIRNGIEDLMIPFTKMYITQGSKTWSHSGAMAMDVTNGDGSRAPYYAPCTVRCVTVYPSTGQVIWQSVNKVRMANGLIDYVNICTAHDDTVNAKVGMVIPQGNQFANMGSRGIGTGIHAHYQLSVGKINPWGYIKGSFVFNGVTNPVYGFREEKYDIDDISFIDDTTILSGKGKWKKRSSVTVGTKKITEWKDTVLKVGDTVKTNTLSIKSFKGDSVYIEALGAYMPAKYLTEADASDGKKDQILMNKKAKVYLNPTIVQAVDKTKNLAKVNGVWVKAKPLLVKVVRYE